MKNENEPLDAPLEKADSKKKSSTKEFLSAQVAAFIGTAVDFGVVIFLTEIVGIVKFDYDFNNKVKRLEERNI